MKTFFKMQYMLMGQRDTVGGTSRAHNNERGFARKYVGDLDGMSQEPVESIPCFAKNRYSVDRETPRVSAA